jgi:hypothetical protein
MENNSSTPAPIYSDFLEQAKVAQAALKSLSNVLAHKDGERDDDLARVAINKAIKATVCRCLPLG